MSGKVKEARRVNNAAMRRMEETIDEVAIQFGYIATLTSKPIALRYADSVMTRLKSRVIEAIENPESKEAK